MTSVGVSEIVEANNQLTLKLNNGEEIVADRAPSFNRSCPSVGWS